MKDEKWTKNGRVGNDDENTDRGVFEAIERSCLLDERVIDLMCKNVKFEIFLCIVCCEALVYISKHIRI